MTQASIKLSEADVESAKRALRHVKNGGPTALMRAINKGVTGGNTEIARETTKILNLTQTRVKKDVSLKKASTRDLSGKITTKGRPVNLIEFGSRANKTGVSVQVLKSKPRATVAGAFIFIGRNNNKLVGWRKITNENAAYINTQKKDSRISYGALPRKYRFPVEGLTGPRVQDITGRDTVIRVINENVSTRMSDELARQVDVLFEKARVM